MPSHVEASEIIAWLDATLAETSGGDYSGAWNGLQVSNRGAVSRILAAVDASPKIVARACQWPQALLIVHHGLFWNDIRPLVGTRRDRFAEMLAANLAVYSSHLPLDRHPTYGNNALLGQALGLEPVRSLCEEFGGPLGFIAECGGLPLQDLQNRLELAVGGQARLIPFGPKTVSQVAVVTGGAASLLAKARDAGADTFITGEAGHTAFVAAQELGMNLLLGGHYATETFGVKALAAAAATRFGLEWEFLDDPSGL